MNEKYVIWKVRRLDAKTYVFIVTFFIHTLESGIVVSVGIIVLVGIFVKIDKYTGWNKRTGGNYHQTKYTKSKIYFQVSYSNFNATIILH